MMNYCMKFGDTNFIGIANAEQYHTFVDEDWTLESLLEHFTKEMTKGNLLISQMTDEGIEHSWNVTINIGTMELNPDCFRRDIRYLSVTNNELYLVDYNCLTMAAQFDDEKVPDENFSNYQIPADNGNYKVEVIQYYNVDQNEYTGSNETDILFNFIKTSNFQPTTSDVLWCTF